MRDVDSFFDDFRMNMKYYRELRGLSQSELAIQADSSNGMIGNIEAGKAHPSFKSILSIAEALHIHPADLFLRDASQSKEDIRRILTERLCDDIKRLVDASLS
ncbi:MAG TPA: hypothetical protein DDW78_01660 [Treponema sp.]|nr:hypothetical protein [Treponema sp.]